MFLWEERYVFEEDRGRWCGRNGKRLKILKGIAWI